ncbi:glycosyltransferase [Saccharicrinis aurantiacus]|uniref:glycosyltransferase n=1 Tax=Saccharicrinis aurantiacus TaxID=1849719 RepID=UPI0024912A61|nr:glycosyltransferase [Saccharicrinis aurantiacus]
MRQKVRVLQILHGLAPAGTEAFVLNTVEHLDKDKLEVSYLIAVNDRQYHQDHVESLGHKVYMTCDLNGIVKLFKHFYLLYKTLKKFGPFDVCHSHMDFLNGLNLFVAYLAKVKIRVSHSHNSAKIEDNLLVKYYRKTMRLFINTFANVKLGCSHDANEFLYGIKACEKSQVIYNGIDLNNFKVLERKPNLNFITVGRMVRQKNCLFLVNVIAELKKIYPLVKLSWVGDGSDRISIEKKIRELGLCKNIELLGVRKDIPQLLVTPNYFLMPSLYEGLPFALVEAQAAGLPCFISDGVPKQANIGLCMFIPLALSAEEWAKKIANYIEGSTKRMKLDKEALGKFDIKTSSKVVEQIYLQN